MAFKSLQHFVDLLGKGVRLLIFFLLSFIPKFSNAQQWIEIPGTRILFSNFIGPNEENWYKYQYEYFKKGDELLMVNKNVALSYSPKGFWGLYDVFRKAPWAFDSIIQNATPQYDFFDTSQWHFTDSSLNEMLEDADSNLVKIRFKKLVPISNLERVDGFKEEIWILTIFGIMSEDTCYFNLIFKKKKAQKGKFTLKLLSARRSFCEI